jgi:hypothetical protein
VSAPQNIIAVVFDFDDTLANDSTTALLQSKGIDTADFWNNKAAKLIADGWDPTPAYLKLILDNVGKGKPLGMLTNSKLREFGKSVQFYPGLPGLFKDLRKLAKDHTISNPAIEFYVISGGLEEVIRGSSIAPYMSGIWGCNFAEANGHIAHIKNLVSFTEKTKYLYAIHKGVTSSASPYAVNERVEAGDRRIPFPNIVYLGDGLTDVPCFSLLDHFGGKAFGVFDPKRAGASKKAWEGLLAPKRVSSMNAPRYRKSDDLGALLRVLVKSKCLELDVRTQAVRR